MAFKLLTFVPSFQNVSKLRGIINFRSVSSDSQKLIISENCVRRLKYVLPKEKENKYLRIVVEGGGCSGFQYKFNLDNSIKGDDKVFEKDGVKVVIDSTSLEFVNGATVDYNEELIRSAFRITDNPMAEQGCSCGASFSIKM